ncbi:MAG: 16S rRNA (guanine(966)-N(2))-methyltransferase RsmD [Psychroflexus sp.]|nr:16S rRNA (guanine(966)-N(2))-methyltransferase RsmD [Psychroflexus sp.]MDN6309740.1 16S rRNA (guanine(966)-N(2))-methyltransferase RsmD [Psychroflexus sp.]
MRIISGLHKGRRVNAPKNLPTRPTTDRAKEALFNILEHQYHFSEISVLDLFAGIGSISLEFSSRGVHDISLVEKNINCIKHLNQTFEDLAYEAKIYKRDVFQYLEQNKQKYNLIFADPPYEITKEKLNELITLINTQRLLKNEDSQIIIEHNKFISMEDHSQFVQSRRYGLSVFSFFEKV